MERLRANIMTKLNFEMGNTADILGCRDPDSARRSLSGSRETRRSDDRRRARCHRQPPGFVSTPSSDSTPMASASVCSLIPTKNRSTAPTGLGAEMIELHTGKLANAFTEKVEAQELDRLCQCARHAFAIKTTGQRRAWNQLSKYRAHSQNSASHRAQHRARYRVARNFCGLGKCRSRNAGADGELQGVRRLVKNVTMLKRNGMMASRRTKLRRI